jgi:GntR family transcriptional regulator
MQNPIPLYFKVEEALKNRIHNGEYEVGEPIPTEPELQKEFGVSRLTVREAIKRLVTYGLLEIRRGKGTFVAKPNIYHRVGFLMSPSEEILLRNYELITKVIEMKIINANGFIANQLKIDINEEVFFLERLRYANDIPAQLIISYLPYSYVSKMETINFTDNYLYKTLEEHYKYYLEEADETIEATKADSEVSKLLEIEIQTPILVTKRSTFLKNGAVIEYNNIFYKPNLLNYNIKLKGRDTSYLLHRIVKNNSDEHERR